MSGEMRCGIRNGLTPTVCYRYERQAQVNWLQKRRCCAPCDRGGEGAERIRQGEAPSPPPPESTRWAQMVVVGRQKRRTKTELGLFLYLQNLWVGFLRCKSPPGCSANTKTSRVPFSDVFFVFQQPPSAPIGSTPLEGAAMGLLPV